MNRLAPDTPAFDTDGHPFRPIVIGCHRVTPILCEVTEADPRAYYEGLAAHVRKIERRERLATWFRKHGSLFNALCVAVAMLSAGYVAGRVLL